MKLELVKYPLGEGSFDVPTHVGVALVSSGVARMASGSYDTAWYAMMRRGYKDLTTRERRLLQRSLPSSIGIPHCPPAPFLSKIRDAIITRLNTHNFLLVWAGSDETEVLTSVGYPRACRLGELAMEDNGWPTVLQPLIEKLPGWDKYSSGLFRMPLTRLATATFDLEAALIEFFSAAFVNEIERVIEVDRKCLRPIEKVGIIRVDPVFSVLRLDERDFNEAAFVAFARMGFQSPTYK